MLSHEFLLVGRLALGLPVAAAEVRLVTIARFALFDDREVLIIEHLLRVLVLLGDDGSNLLLLSDLLSLALRHVIL